MYEYKGKHLLCVTFGFWLNITTELVDIRTSNEKDSKRYADTYYELYWGYFPLLGIGRAFQVFRIWWLRRPIETDVDGFQALLDHSHIVDMIPPQNNIKE